MELEKYKQITNWANELGGVLAISDLKVAFNTDSTASLFRAINEFLRAGEFIKIKRGFYATPSAKLSTVAQRLYPKSYISTGTVLAKEALIGSIPAKKIQSVKVGLPRIFECELGTIEFLSIAPKLYFGFRNINGELVATPEKAFLDVCYYYYKGKTFSFDPQSDIAYDELDQKVLSNYLPKYDKRFLTYYKKKWG